MARPTSSKDRWERSLSISRVHSVKDSKLERLAHDQIPFECRLSSKPALLGRTSCRPNPVETYAKARIYDREGIHRLNRVEWCSSNVRKINKHMLALVESHKLAASAAAVAKAARTCETPLTAVHSASSPARGTPKVSTTLHLHIGNIIKITNNLCDNWAGQEMGRRKLVCSARSMLCFEMAAYEKFPFPSGLVASGS